MIDAADIIAVTSSVTKKWTKQQKSEERDSRARSRRVYMYEPRVAHTDVTNQILPKAYAHASGNGQYTVSQRQFYYACRESFRLRTGRELKYEYFANTLLRQYLNRHPTETKGWKVTADSRGTLTIPNAGYSVRIPCGTIPMQNHMREARREVTDPYELPLQRLEYPSLAPGVRYQAVLYVEKEGFDPLMEEAQLQDNYDIACLSCKGMSVTAAREYVDEVCRVNGGIPLFVVHDFDKAGFDICQRLTTVSDWAEASDRVAYHFKHAVNVTDFGLRLEDVKEYSLADEAAPFRGRFAPDCPATREEREFLKAGRRVELNAFTAPQFIEWITSKLDEHLPGRLIPTDDDLLEKAYRRALFVAEVNSAMRAAREAAEKTATTAKIPSNLRSQLKKAMRDEEDAWDVALHRLAETKLSASSKD